MQNYLISIVSEQTIPNYLLIKEFQNKYKIDNYIFISTRKMENKNITTLICETAKIEKKNRNKILIKEDLLNQNLEKLSKLNLTDEHKYFINLTGGTKLMAIAVYNFFHKFKNVRYFYIPIGKNSYTEIFDEKAAESCTFDYQISVEEYLSIYNIRFETVNLVFNQLETINIYKDVKAGQFDLDKFPRKKLKKFKIPPNNKQIHTKWFEEFVYYDIIEKLNIKKEQIATGLKLFEKNLKKSNEFYPNDNEIDVIFIYENKPYLIECKFSVGKQKINTTTLGNIIYKLSAVNRRFGISTKSTIFTLSNFSNLNDQTIHNIERRCAITGVHFPFFDRKTINNQTYLVEKLKEFTKK